MEENHTVKILTVTLKSSSLKSTWRIANTARRALCKHDKCLRSKRHAAAYKTKSNKTDNDNANDIGIKRGK